MTFSRRKFVSTSFLAAAAAISVPSVFAQSFKERDGNPGDTPPVQTDPLANYSKAAFVSYLNSVFQIHTVAGVVEVTLARVDDMPAAKGGECFSLLFRGGNKALKQDTYVLVHPSLSTFQLLLVPGGSDRNGAQEYLATINRLALADLANMTPPSRSASGARSSGSPSGSSTSNTSVTNTSSTSPSTSTSTSTSTVTSPVSPQTSVGPTVTPVKSPSRHRKRKPSRKHVDDKAAVIN